MVEKGLILVISGPSGSGKGTIVNLLTESKNNFKSSVSATTRKRREGEEEGISYYFVTKKEFNEMIKKDELIEWVEYCGHYYGTPQKCVDEAIDNGEDILLEVEVIGAKKIKAKYPDSILVFVLPPSYKELRKRLEKRGTEGNKTIEKRMERAKLEFMQIGLYDYLIINDKIDEATDRIKNIANSEKLRVKRNINAINKWEESFKKLKVEDIMEGLK